MQLLTQTQFAQRRGVSKGAVSNWKAAGLLVLAEGPNGKPLVDVVRTEAKLNAKLDPMRGRPSTGGGLDPAPALPLGEGGAPAPSASPAPSAAPGGLADERMQHLREQRVGAALKNAQLAGDLVPLIEAEQRVAEVGRAARERMHAWLRSVAERFAAETEVRAIMALGEEGIDQVFAELADAAAAGDFAGADDSAGELTADELAEQEAAAQAEA